MPRARREGLQRLDDVELLVAAAGSRPASRVPSGAGSPRRYLPLSRPLASGK